MVYVVAIQRQGKSSYKITLPISWVKENIDLASRVMYLVPKDIGVLEILSERSWYDRYFSKGGDESDKGTTKSGEGSDGSGIPGGVGGEPENEGLAPADHIIKRA